MKTRSLLAAGAALLAMAAAACTDLTGGGSRLTTLFATAPLNGEPVPGFTASSSVPGTLDVVGGFGSVGCVNGEHARADRHGSTVTFRVTVSRTQGGACPDSTFFTVYQARVAGLKGKTYHLRIEHYGTTDAGTAGTLGDGLRYEQDVQVK